MIGNHHRHCCCCQNSTPQTDVMSTGYKQVLRTASKGVVQPLLNREANAANDVDAYSFLMTSHFECPRILWLQTEGCEAFSAELNAEIE